MPDDKQPMATITIRVTEEEGEILERLRERMQERATMGIKVTQRMVILAALERLRAHLDKLDRDKGRER